MSRVSAAVATMTPCVVPSPMPSLVAGAPLFDRQSLSTRNRRWQQNVLLWAALLQPVPNTACIESAMRVAALTT